MAVVARWMGPCSVSTSSRSKPTAAIVSATSGSPKFSRLPKAGLPARSCCLTSLGVMVTEYSARCGSLWPMLTGKTGLVFGVANKRSIAWAIAQALAGAGMRLAFTYQGERLKDNVEELAATLPGSTLYPCDVGADAEIAAVFAGVERDLGRLDTLVHSVAFARKEDLEGEFVATEREGFRVAHDVSAYSLVALTRAAAPLMVRGGGGSVIAMTYYGAEKVAAGYNVMGVAKASLEAAVRYLAADLGPRGIRVNAISAGPGDNPGPPRPPRRRPRPPRDPGERHLGGPGEHAGRPRHPRLHRDAEAPRRKGATAAQRGA